jgi:hypothetical protein
MCGDVGMAHKLDKKAGVWGIVEEGRYIWRHGLPMEFLEAS